jgi:hypothetical protein
VLERVAHHDDYFTLPNRSQVAERRGDLCGTSAMCAKRRP